MEVQALHRGRLIDHVQLVVQDIDASRRFYDAIFAALGIPLGGTIGNSFWYDELFVSPNGGPETIGLLTGRVHLAFQAADKTMVEAFHKAGVAAGGADHGKPGMRPYHPSYYAAFLTDPDGNNIEAVFHGPHKRSAPSVEVTF